MSCQKKQKRSEDEKLKINSAELKESVIVDNTFLRKQLGEQQQQFNDMSEMQSVDQIDERDIIYKENIYDKLILSPLQKYQKYGKYPIKMIVHIFLVLLTTSQILYSSNTLSTNSTEQYEQWRTLFFEEQSNTNVKNNDFENKIIYYSTVEKLQNQLILMFQELNKNNSERIQDVYFNYSKIDLSVFYNYPMDQYLYYHPITRDEENVGSDGEEDTSHQDMENHDRRLRLARKQQKEQLFEDKEISKDDYSENRNYKMRDFYNQLNRSMNSDKHRILNTHNKNKTQNLQYKQVQLVFPINREKGIVEPFDMKNKTQIKLIFQYTDRFQLNFQNVILIKSNLVSCWDLLIDYTLYGHATIRAILQADGGVCSDDMFNKGIKLHQEENKEDTLYSQQNSQKKQDLKVEAVDNMKLDEEKIRKRQLMKVRGTKFNSKNQQKKERFSKKNRKKENKNILQDQVEFMKYNKNQFSDDLDGEKSPQFDHITYEKNGNLYRSGNLLFIGFNTFIDVFTLIASVTSLILCLKYLVQIMNVYIHTFKKSTKVYLQKEQRKQLIIGVQKNKSKYMTLQRILAEQRPWQELSLQDKMQYFDLWFFVILVGNFFQLVGSFYLIFLDTQSELEQRISVIDWTVGIGCFCSWFSLMRYLEYSNSLSIILEVLRFALPELFKVLIEFSVVYISFIIVGMTSFWQSERFSDIRSTAVTLFGLVMADSIYDVIQDTEENGVLPHFMAQIYVILFVLMFIICVTNIMIGILEDGYSRNKQELRFKRTIKNFTDEKQRAVVSKMVEKKERRRGNATRRQNSFDSDDGIKYGKNGNLSYVFSPLIQQQFLSPKLQGTMYSQQQSITKLSNFNTTPNISKLSFQKSDKSKTSPLVQMKMVANAGLAIQKTKRFIQIKKNQEKKESNSQQTENQLLQEKADNTVPERERSLFDEQSQPIFQITLPQEQTDVNENSSFDTKVYNQRRSFSFRTLKKSKTLHNIDLKQSKIDEQSSESDDNDKVDFRKVESQEDLDDSNAHINSKQNRHSPKKIPFNDYEISSIENLDSNKNLTLKKKQSHQDYFKQELENMKKKEIFVQKTITSFNSCYKQLKSQIEESSKLMINTKYFNISKIQKNDLITKYSQYLQYFQQRVAASLLELEHFQMD